MLPLGEAATTRAVSDRYLDNKSSLGAAYRAAWKRLPSLIALILILVAAYVGLIAALTAVLLLFAAVGAGAAGGAVAILALLALIPLAIIVAVRTVIAVPAIVLERTSGWGGLKRSLGARERALLADVRSDPAPRAHLGDHLGGRLDGPRGSRLVARSGQHILYQQVASAVASVSIGPITYGASASCTTTPESGRKGSTSRCSRARCEAPPRREHRRSRAAHGRQRGVRSGGGGAAVRDPRVSHIARPRRSGAGDSSRADGTCAHGAERGERVAPSAGADLGPIIAAVSATPPDLTGGRQRLATIASTLTLPSGSVCNVDSQASLNLLHQVYSSSVFADLDQNQQPSILERIGEAINWLLSHLFGLLGTGGSIAVGLLVLAAIVAFVAYRVRGVVGPGAPSSRTSRAQRETTRTMSGASQWPPRSGAIIARRSGARFARRCSRSRDGERTWIVRGQLREMLATLSADAYLLAVLAPAAAAFDEAWYSGEAVGPAEWDLARARCEAVRRVARRGAGASSS